MKRISILLVLLAISVAACSSPQASESEVASEPSSTPEATAEPTEEPTEEPSEEPSEVAAPSLSEGAGDLADVLPEEVGGITIQYQHAVGEEVMGGQAITPEARALFDRIGADPSDMSSAFGVGFDAEGGGGISLIAFRINGADEAELRDEFLATMEQQGDAVAEEQTVGGKTVHAFGDGTRPTQGYVYVNDDTVFIVGGEPVELAEEALAALP